MGFAKRAGKSVLSAGAAVLKDMIEGKNAREFTQNALAAAEMSHIDDAVSSTTGKKRKTADNRGGKWKKQNVPATSITKRYICVSFHPFSIHSTSTARY